MFWNSSISNTQYVSHSCHSTIAAWHKLLLNGFDGRRICTRQRWWWWWWWHALKALSLRETTEWMMDCTVRFTTSAAMFVLHHVGGRVGFVFVFTYLRGALSSDMTWFMKCGDWSGTHLPWVWITKFWSSPRISTRLMIIVGIFSKYRKATGVLKAIRTNHWNVKSLHGHCCLCSS